MIDAPPAGTSTSRLSNSRGDPPGPPALFRLPVDRGPGPFGLILRYSALFLNTAIVGFGIPILAGQNDSRARSRVSKSPSARAIPDGAAVDTISTPATSV